MVSRKHIVFYGLKERFKADVFSRDFLRDPSYVDNRCERIIGGKTFDGRSVLRFILDSGLTDEERQEVFSEKFDLGNARIISDEECTYEAFSQELELLDCPKTEGAKFLERADIIRLLNDTASLLGHESPEERQPGAGQLFKVAKLLHEFKQRNGLLQIMHILRPPTEETASLELMNPYFYGAESDLRWHMVDLQGYLSSEISTERLGEIDSTFGLIRSSLDNFINSVGLHFKKTQPHSNDDVLLRYEIALKQWSSRSSQPQRKVLRADEQLYVTMYVLDFLHYAMVEHKLRRERLLHSTVAPVPEVLTLPRISLNDLCAAEISDSVRLLSSLLNVALGTNIPLKEFKSYLTSAQAILNHWLALNYHMPPPDEEALTCLAAIVVAREMRKHPKSYKPRLYGSARGQSHSVKAAMKPGRPVSSTHEEFERIINNALQWVRYALIGQSDIFTAHMAFHMRMVDTTVLVLSTHETGVVQNFISNMERYARYSVNGVVEKALLKNTPATKQ